MSRPWTKLEEIDVTRWYNAGMTSSQIAEKLEPPRTPHAVDLKLSKLTILRRSGESLPPNNIELADRALRAEIEAAKREKPYTRPLKVSPLVWRA